MSNLTPKNFISKYHYENLKFLKSNFIFINLIFTYIILINKIFELNYKLNIIFLFKQTILTKVKIDLFIKLLY